MLRHYIRIGFQSINRSLSGGSSGGGGTPGQFNVWSDDAYNVFTTEYNVWTSGL